MSPSDSTLESSRKLQKIQALRLHPGTRVWERKPVFTIALMPYFCITASGLWASHFLCLKCSSLHPLPFTSSESAQDLVILKNSPASHCFLYSLSQLTEYGFAILALHMIKIGVISSTPRKTTSFSKWRSYPLET